MSSTGQIGDSAAGYEATLHLVTHAPVPEGLQERVQAALESAPRRGRLLEWPGAAGWLRSAAAAAIVFVVAGGGWGVYRHAQLHQPAKVTATPAPQVSAPTSGGFSSAGAIRTPQTVKGPEVGEEPKPNVEKKQLVVKPISQWDSNSPQAGAKNSATSTKKRSAVKPIPLATNPVEGVNETGTPVK
jgi:hypothetical protein